MSDAHREAEIKFIDISSSGGGYERNGNLDGIVSANFNQDLILLSLSLCLKTVDNDKRESERGEKRALKCFSLGCPTFLT